jgi:hypothetical protein
MLSNSRSRPGSRRKRRRQHAPPGALHQTNFYSRTSTHLHPFIHPRHQLLHECNILGLPHKHVGALLAGAVNGRQPGIPHRHCKGGAGGNEGQSAGWAPGHVFDDHHPAAIEATPNIAWQARATCR